MDFRAICKQRAEQDGDRRAWTFLSSEEQTGTYGALVERANQIGAHLTARVSRDERVVLLLEPGPDFMESFLGCMFASVIPVPAYLPDGREETQNALALLIQDCTPAAVLTTENLKERLSNILARNPVTNSLDLITVDQAPGQAVLKREPLDIAFLQYTSGSTARPKGVVVSQANLLDNLGHIRDHFAFRSGDCLVSWLPQYHDMGLIGNMLLSIYAGVPLVFMSPMWFLQKPRRWLEAISRYRGTHSGGPNFAFDLCVNQIKDTQGIDLSSWRVAFNASEPVRAQTLQQFAHHFQSCGFKKQAFFPCYGLAEATLAVSGGPNPRVLTLDPAELNRDRVVQAVNGNKLVSCGRVIPNHTLRIVNPQTDQPTEGIGEIQVKGPGITAGYWNDGLPTSTPEAFLKTGDLGFVHKGELYITGRIKERLIIRGRNYYPMDLESAIQQVNTAFVKGGGAAFSVDAGGEEKVVVVQEVHHRQLRQLDKKQAVADVREKLSQQFHLPLFALVFTRPGAIPKTTSGKIQRGLCREWFLSNSLRSEMIWRAEPPQDTLISPLYDSLEPGAGKTMAELLSWLRRWGAERVNSRLMDERRTLSPHVVMDLANRGILGMEAPTQYGGLGLKHAEIMAVMRQLAAIDITIASMVGVHLALGTKPLLYHGSTRAQDMLLPILASGRQLGAFAITEPGAGSNPRQIRARAVPHGNGWKLYGEKSWIGNGSWSGMLNVFVQAEDNDGKPLGITGFVVRQGSPGLRQGAESLTMGVRGMVQNTVHLEGVYVTTDNLLGNLGEGLEVAQTAMNYGRLGIAATASGAMKHASLLMWRHAGRRRVATGRLADNPITNRRLTTLVGHTIAIDALVACLCQWLDQGKDVPTEAFAVCKTTAPEFLWQGVDQLMQQLGGRGYIEANGVAQMMRDARLLRIFEGPTEALTMYLGSRLLNEPESMETLFHWLNADAALHQLKERGTALRLKNRANHSEMSADLLTYEAMGEALGLTMLEAALDYQARNSEQKTVDYAHARLTLRGRPQLRQSQWIVDQLAQFEADIGSPEQRLAGEDQQMDALLQMNPPAQATGDVRATQEAPSPASYGEAVSPQEETIRSLLAEILQVPADQISITTPLTQTGLDSLSAGLLVTALKERHGLVVALSQLFNGETVQSLAAQLSLERTEVTAPQTIQCRPEDSFQPFPLTEMQQAYWIGRNESFDQSDVALHGYLELEVADFSKERFESAWNSLIQRHPMLRAYILPDGTQQVKEDVPPFQLTILDLRNGGSLEAVREDMSHRVYSLEQSPQYELALSLLPNGQTHLHISLDATFVDVWSFEVLSRELVSLYRGETLSPPPTLSFRDYVLAEQEERDSVQFEQSRSWWMERLVELPGAPDLPKATGASGVTRFLRQAGRLEKPVWQRLKQCASEHGLTPAGLLLAAYGEVLAQWSGNRSFSINVPLFNRQPRHDDVNRVLGNFSTFTLVDYQSLDSFERRAQHIQHQLLEGIAHQHYPGVLILRERYQKLGSREAAMMPIVFTSLPTGLAADTAMDQLQECFGPLRSAITQTPQVWLDNQVSEDANGLTIHWDYVAGFFADGIIPTMFKAYLELLHRLSDHQIWKQKDLELLPAEQRAVRARDNSHTLEVPPINLPQLLDGADPNAPALLSDHGCLTHGALQEASNRLARHLQHSGVGTGDAVAVCLHKSIQQVVAVLGILKTGAAYVPLDADLPVKRLQWMLADAGARHVIADPETLPASLTQVTPIFLDSLSEVSADPVDCAAQPQSPAYIIYTSGSTGQPKGVTVSHHSAVNLVVCTNHCHQVTDQDRVLGLTPLHHDLSVYDLFGPLAAGGALVLPNSDQRKEPKHWEDLIGKYAVTLWNTVPAMMGMMLTRGSSGLRGLRLIILGGDWIPLALARQLRRDLPETKLLSIGGPTETTVWNIWYEVDEVEASWPSVPYGKPMPNAAYHIFDEQLSPCPNMVPGEMYCSGAGLALGYHGNQQATDAAFLHHPETGQRLYRTGDFGRYLPDGTIEFLGRRDNQIKRNGFRIEAGEIEAALAQHPDVADAVVVPIKREGNTSLAAFVLTQHKKSMDTREQALFKLSQPGLRQLETEIPAIPLPDETAAVNPLARQSVRTFKQQPVTKTELAQLLGALRRRTMPESPVGKYRYPSGGGLYGVQTYLSVRAGRVQDLEEGLYYYHPQDHQLRLLQSGPIDQRQDHWSTNRGIYDSAAFTLFLVGKLDAFAPIYGPLARDFCLMEAGYMGQLLMETASDHELGLCPLGKLAWDGLPECFGLPADAPVHALLGGGLPPNWLETIHPEMPTAEEPVHLRQWLKDFLPAHMIPDTVTQLEAWPLTANGKVDRARLVAEAAAENASGKERTFVAPQTPLQRELTEMWSELLGVDDLSITDSIFERGGDSLNATRFIAQLRQRHGLELPLKAVFERPDVASMAEYVETIKRLATAEAPQDPIGEDEEEGEF